MGTTTTDAIRKDIVLNAPRERVWQAISDPAQFGAWFHVDMTGVTFAPGQPVNAKMTEPGYEGHSFEIVIDRIEPPRLFSFRWHPYGIDPDYDYSSEPMTLIVFELEEVDGGTRLTVTESGFDAIPLSRRAEAFRLNGEGWAIQLRRVEAYVGDQA